MLLFMAIEAVDPKLKRVSGLLAGSAGLDDQFDGMFHELFVAPVQVCPAAGGADASASRQAAAIGPVIRVRSTSASRARAAGEPPADRISRGFGSGLGRL